MRWAFYNALKEQYEPAIPVSMTYGYLTKNTRIRHNLPKEHHIDARCISGNPDAVSDGTYYYQKKMDLRSSTYVDDYSGIVLYYTF